VSCRACPAELKNPLFRFITESNQCWRRSKESALPDAISMVPLETPFGEISIQWHNGKLEAIKLSEFKPTGQFRLRPLSVSDKQLAGLIDALAAYLSGEAIRISVPLEFFGYTNFQRDVWRLVSELPYGETRTYGWVAAQLGNPGAGRAVGRALAENPFPIVVPCHRIVRADGSLGGFSAGLKWKRALLQLEGIHLK